MSTNQFPLDKFLSLKNQIPKPNEIQKREIESLVSSKNIGEEILSSSSQSNNIDTDFSVDELQEINNTLLGEIRLKVSEPKFNAYFNGTFSLSKIISNQILFNCTTQFIKTMIDSHYLNIIQESILEVLGKQYDVCIDVLVKSPITNSYSTNMLNSASLDNTDNNKKISSVKDATFQLNLTPTKDDLINEVESKYLEHMSATHYGVQIDTKKTFDTFVVGPSNNMAYASTIAVAKNPGKNYPSLYLHSNSGLGKTHLLHAVANTIRTLHPTLAICITTARDFMTEMVNAMQSKKINEFRKKYSEKIDVLMVDDIHELKNKQSTQNEFFHVFNELYNKGKQLIFTSDKHPKEIDGIEERIKTRLSWGLVLDIQQPDLETRMAILKNKAIEEDIYLPDDVVSLIAGCVKTNIRELEGSLIRLGAYSSVFEVDIDVEIAKEQLKLTENFEEKIITLDKIGKVVSNYFKIPIADLHSKARSKEITYARHIAMSLSYKIIHTTLVEIGTYYGGRDHTSVLHAVDKIKRQLKTDQTLAQNILDIENSL